MAFLVTIDLAIFAEFIAFVCDILKDVKTRFQPVYLMTGLIAFLVFRKPHHWHDWWTTIYYRSFTIYASAALLLIVLEKLP